MYNDLLPDKLGDRNGDCRKESVKYQIRCDRPPCNVDIKEEQDNINIGSNDTERLLGGVIKDSLEVRTEILRTRVSCSDTPWTVMEVFWAMEVGIKGYKLSLQATDKKHALSRQCR